MTAAWPLEATEHPKQTIGHWPERVGVAEDKQDEQNDDDVGHILVTPLLHLEDQQESGSYYHGNHHAQAAHQQQGFATKLCVCVCVCVCVCACVCACACV